MRQIAEHGDGRTADCGAADQDWSVPAEVMGPFMAARIVKPGALASLRIDAGAVRSLMVVVGEAGESEVPNDRPAPMLLGDDVIDLEWELIIKRA